MSYSLNSLQDDCYENTNILKNKFNLQEQTQLDLVERNITSVLIAQALISIPFENVNFQFYKNLHLYIFYDIYEWAGTVRIINMSKKKTLFCDFKNIESTARDIFEGLRKNNFLKNFSNNEFINEFTELYCNLNYLHPFREGNGRIQRLFMTMLLKNMGKFLDFSKIDKDLLMIATIKSVSGDIFMLRDIFSTHIKDFESA